jgi:hypothetical protein
MEGGVILTIKMRTIVPSCSESMEQITTKGKWEVKLTKNLCLVHGQITMKTKCGSKMLGSIQIHTCACSICWPFNLNE